MAATMRGEVLRPGDEGYDDAVTGYQLGRPHRPDLVALPLERDDLAAALALAAGGPVAVQRTGHGRRTPVDGGVLLDTRHLDHVVVDADARTARVGAGAVWADVVAAAAEHDLAPLSGSSPEVGVVGYLRGGGLGLLGRRFGWARDHARETDAVGDVVAEVEVDLFPVATVRGANLAFGTEAIGEVFAAHRDLTQGLTPDVSTSVAVVALPDLDGVPAPIRGRRIAQLRVVGCGDEAAADGFVEGFTARVGEPLMGEPRTVPYREATSFFTDPPTPHAYLGDNAVVGDLTGELRDALVAGGSRCVIQVNHLGGALSDDDRYVVRLLSAMHVVAEDDARADQAALLAAAAPWTVGHVEGFRFGAV